MNQQDNWPTWISAIGAGVVIVVTFLKSFFVTRAELREAIQDSNRIIDQRHAEHLKRLDQQDVELKEIRDGLHHLEGVLSGRYYRVDQ